MALAELQAEARQIRSALDIEAGEAAAVGRAGQAALARTAELTALIDLHERVGMALTRVGEQRQEHAQAQIQGLVTLGLQTIFDDPALSFHLVQSVRAGQANVEFVIRSSYGAEMVDTPVLEARGGGMAAVAGYLVRLVVLLLTPKARRILFADESFAHVSEEFRPALGQFIRDMCARLGVQHVMVTHDPEYAAFADAHYGLFLGADGTTKAEVLRAPEPDTVTS
jgi:DNA repair ATPase RecN